MKIQKIALVTGGFRGLGLEWGKQLIKKEYAVILTGRKPERIKEIEKMSFCKEGDLFFKILDVTKEQQIQKLVAEIEDEFDKLDLLVNNAGVNSRSIHSDFDFHSTVSLKDFNSKVILEMFRINTIAPILMTKYFIDLLQESETAKVINISSWLGSIDQKVSGGNYGYSGSKSALNMLSRTLAFDLKRKNIVTMIVNPGWVKTDMGGERATLTAEESVKGMIENVLEKVTIEQTGRFWDWKGEKVLW